MAGNFSSRGVIISSPNGDMTLVAGANMRIKPSGNAVDISSPTPFGSIINGNGVPWQPPSLADSIAPKNSIYFSTTSNKLVYLDSNGTTHALY